MTASAVRRLAGYGVAAAVVAGCGAGGGQAGRQTASPVPAASVRPSPPAAASPTRSAPQAGVTAPGAAGLPRLSPAQMAGQRVIYSYRGLAPPAGLLRLIRHGEVGGVIFFTGNVSTTGQIAGVISQLDRANASPGNPLRSLPLLLMADQEGGQVRRLTGAPMLAEKQIGASAHPLMEAGSAATGAARNLARAGMNVNLAPVLDVYRTAGGFDDQFGRSYSSDPATVSSLGATFIRALQAGGVAATGKHFPGLGAAASTQDTDERPVTLNVSRHDLRTIDEQPYQAAIRRGVKLVMVSWATYPALDPKRPAGLSPTIVGSELRRRLGFTGVTITDALEAGALRPFGTTRHRATLAARSGMDLILCSQQRVYQGGQARIALQDGLRDGVLNQAAFTAAVRRIIALRSSLRR